MQAEKGPQIARKGPRDVRRGPLADAKRFLPNSIRGLARRIHLWVMLSRYDTKIIEHSYGGVGLRLLLADPMAESWYDRDWPELPELTLLREGRLTQGARVFNLGAHQAVVALMLASEVGDGGHVIAVEASSHNAAIARQNCALNGSANISVVHAACVQEGGKVAFSKTLNGRVEPSRHGVEWVRALSLPDLCSEFGIPDVICLDVEGLELDILAGGEQILRNHRPTLSVEVHAGCGLETSGGSSRRLAEFLANCGYSLSLGREGEGFRPLSSVDQVPADRHFLVAM